MLKRFNKRKYKDRDYSLIYLSSLVAIFYFLYLYLIIFTSTMLPGICMTVPWLGGRDMLMTPYALVFLFVGGIITYAVIRIIIRYFRRGKLSLEEYLYYPVFFYVTGCWMVNLIGLMYMFEYEVGLMPLSDFFVAMEFGSINLFLPFVSNGYGDQLLEIAPMFNTPWGEVAFPECQHVFDHMNYTDQILKMSNP